MNRDYRARLFARGVDNSDCCKESSHAAHPTGLSRSKNSPYSPTRPQSPMRFVRSSQQGTQDDGPRRACVPFAQRTRVLPAHSHHLPVFAIWYQCQGRALVAGHRPSPASQTLQCRSAALRLVHSWTTLSGPNRCRDRVPCRAKPGSSPQELLCKSNARPRTAANHHEFGVAHCRSSTVCTRAVGLGQALDSGFQRLDALLTIDARLLVVGPRRV